MLSPTLSPMNEETASGTWRCYQCTGAYCHKTTHTFKKLFSFSIAQTLYIQLTNPSAFSTSLPPLLYLYSDNNNFMTLFGSAKTSFSKTQKSTIKNTYNYSTMDCSTLDPMSCVLPTHTCRRQPFCHIQNLEPLYGIVSV